MGVRETYALYGSNVDAIAAMSRAASDTDPPFPSQRKGQMLRSVSSDLVSLSSLAGPSYGQFE